MKRREREDERGPKSEFLLLAHIFLYYFMKQRSKRVRLFWQKHSWSGKKRSTNEPPFLVIAKPRMGGYK
jgi:hypothetical protein